MNEFNVFASCVVTQGRCYTKGIHHELFDEYFAALDRTIQLFGALRSNPDLITEAYEAKNERTAILNRLMRLLNERGIRSFTEGHRLYYEERINELHSVQR